MKGFLTVDFPIVEGLAFDVLYQPAAAIEHIGGDWYDIFTLPDGRVAFSLGDVRPWPRRGGENGTGETGDQGRGIASDQRPHATRGVGSTNKVIFLNDNQVQFTTAIYGIIDVANRKVTYASAGHHPPILAKLGEEPRIMPNHGFPLGVELNLPDLIREHEFSTSPGTCWSCTRTAS